MEAGEAGRGGREGLEPRPCSASSQGSMEWSLPGLRVPDSLPWWLGLLSCWEGPPAPTLLCARLTLGNGSRNREEGQPGGSVQHRPPILPAQCQAPSWPGGRSGHPGFTCGGAHGSLPAGGATLPLVGTACPPPAPEATSQLCEATSCIASTVRQGAKFMSWDSGPSHCPGQAGGAGAEE